MLFYLHAGLMLSGVLLMAAGMMVARYLKTKRWWLKGHKTMEAVSFFLLVTALPCGILTASASGAPHFTGWHAILGLLVFLISLITLLVGFLQLRNKSLAVRLRPVHRWLGRTAMILYLVNIGFGISSAGFW